MIGDFVDDSVVLTILAFLLSVFISFFLAKRLWNYSVEKGFTAKPNHRSSHKVEVPNTGGILLFFAIAIPMLFFSDLTARSNILYIALSYIALFTVGVIDDLKSTSVRFKLAGQFVTAILLILSLYNQELVIPFLRDFELVPWIFRYIFWVVTVVAIINAYNFIDGIDGLAIGLGAISGLSFGIYFYMQNHVNLALFGFVLFGALMGLLRQNLSLERKIFIGDTGSLIIGGIISLFVLRHLEMNASNELNFSSSMVFGVLFIPVSDMIRVVLSRIFSGKSPMKADRTHIHHVIMDTFNISHRRTSFVIIVVQLVIFFTFLLFNRRNENGQVAFSILMFAAYIGGVYCVRKFSATQSQKAKTRIHS